MDTKVLAIIGPPHCGKAVVADIMAKVLRSPVVSSTARIESPSAFSFALERLIMVVQSIVQNQQKGCDIIITTIDPHSDIQVLVKRLSPEETELLKDLIDIMKPPVPTMRIFVSANLNDLFTRIWTRRHASTIMDNITARDSLDAWTALHTPDDVVLRIPIFADYNSIDSKLLRTQIEYAWAKKPWDVKGFKGIMVTSEYGFQENSRHDGGRPTTTRK
jgi:hypothetical protein